MGNECEERAAKKIGGRSSLKDVWEVEMEYVPTKNHLNAILFSPTHSRAVARLRVLHLGFSFFQTLILSSIEGALPVCCITDFCSKIN